MSFPHLSHTVIGCFYDCDQTLIPGNMQEPLFQHYGIEPAKFWDEAKALIPTERHHGVHVDTENAYLNLMLDYVERGTFPVLSNARLREFGSHIPVFPGLPDFFRRTKALLEENPCYQMHGLTVEHYIITTGLKEMVVGSKLYDGGHLTDVFGSEFREKGGIVRQIARSIGHMKKTEFLHRVNKGANLDQNLDVNRRMPHHERRIPFQNMLYVGDGFTDVPCFALINDRGGKAYGVYHPTSAEARQQAEQLLQEQRVLSISPADYSPGSVFSQRFEQGLEEIARGIVQAIQERKKG